jgi:hypothetical protein
VGSIEVRDIFDDDGRAAWVRCGPMVEVPSDILFSVEAFWNSEFTHDEAKVGLMTWTDLPPDFDGENSPWTEVPMAYSKFLQRLSLALNYPGETGDLSHLAHGIPTELSTAVYQTVTAVRDLIIPSQHKETGKLYLEEVTLLVTAPETFAELTSRLNAMAKDRRAWLGTVDMAELDRIRIKVSGRETLTEDEIALNNNYIYAGSDLELIDALGVALPEIGRMLANFGNAIPVDR